MRVRLFIYLVSIFAFSKTCFADQPSLSISQALNDSLNVVTISTESRLGDDVAQKFTQLIYLQKMQVQSSVVLEEKRVSGRKILLTLQTPLRIISTHHLSISQNRYRNEPQEIALAFLADAREQGLLVPSN